MHRLLASLVLHLVHHLLPLAAMVGVRNWHSNMQWYEVDGHIVSNETLRNCYTALSLMPHTGLEVDPDYITVNRQAPDSKRPISVKLVGKYNINGDRIRFPAAFHSGNCSIIVRTRLGGTLHPQYVYKPARFSPALLQHVYIWPHARQQAKSIIKQAFFECLGRTTAAGTPSLTSQGYKMSELHMDGYTFQFVISVSTNVYSNHSLRFYNVYTPQGQLNDVRWPTPFQRPPKPESTVAR
jgi:hypothetical protein